MNIFKSGESYPIILLRLSLACVMIALLMQAALADSLGDLEAEAAAPVVIALSPFVIIGGFGYLIFRKLTRDPDLYTVWYGTNRVSQSFTYYKYLADQDSCLHYGTCVVAVPRSHKFGSLGSSRVKRFWMRITTGSDDNLTLKKVSQFQSIDSFRISIAQELLKYGSEERSCLLYLHGFNVSFEEAATRAAQIGFDLKVPGVMAFFSWPSMANGIASYHADEDRIAASEDSLTQFIVELSKAAEGGRIHVLAHSMGNRGLLRALNAAKRQAEIFGVSFGQIFLAAPDVDAVLFRQLADVYPRLAARTTLYVSNADRALDVSAKVHKNQRTGYTPPVMIIDGIDTVEVSQLDVGLLGHSYYGQASAVLYDMYTLLRTNLSPDKRASLYAVDAPIGQKYWSVRSRLN